MKDIEAQLAKSFQDEDTSFQTSDQDLINNAVKSANVKQGSKDLVVLGMASIWVVFVNIFLKIFSSVNKQKQQNQEQK